MAERSRDLIGRLTRRIERDAPRDLGRALGQARALALRVVARSAGRVTVLHDEGYTPPSLPLYDRERASKILQYLNGITRLGAADVRSPPDLGVADLFRVHTAAYLESLDDPAVLREIFTDRVTPEAAHALLVAQRAATAGTVYALNLAVESHRARDRKRPRDRHVFANLGGGFHHAHPDHGSGFTAINDVAIAIAKARSRGFRGRVLVIDLDLHQGDGTRACFRTDERVFTYSLHASTWDVSPAIASLDIALGPAIGDDTYLDALRSTLPGFFARAAPDVVVFVAGVDVADGDALGAYRLTDRGIAARDRFVFELAARLPVVMVLAGGYGPDAWRFTARTLGWLMTGVDEHVPSRDEAALSAFRRVRRRLRSTPLSSTDRPRSTGEKSDATIEITEADLYGDLLEKKADPRLLGFYTPFGLEVAIERYGLAKLLRERGYPKFAVSVDAIGTSGRGLRIFADETRRDVLIEVVLSEHFGVSPYRLLSIEWLLLQDPKRAAKPSDDLLPGQRHPGLGALKIVVGMLVMTCERLGFDGITLVPAHFHVAHRARGTFRFLEPRSEALFLALTRATSGLPVAEASRRIARGDVLDVTTGAVARYEPSRMVLAVTDALRVAVESDAYASAVEAAALGLDLRLADG